MNSHKGFSLSSCALAQSEIPWIQFFDKFRCVPRNPAIRRLFFFFQNKREEGYPASSGFSRPDAMSVLEKPLLAGQKKDSLIADTCVLSSIAYTLNVGTVLVCG